MVQFIFNKYFFIGKLLSRSQKIAYNLLKLGPKNDPIVRPGHRVSDYTFSTCPAPLPNMPYSPFKHALLSFQHALLSLAASGRVLFVQVALVYPNSDPLGFLCAFYGCLTAGVVPSPIEVPTSKRVSSHNVLSYLDTTSPSNPYIMFMFLLSWLPRDM